MMPRRRIHSAFLFALLASSTCHAATYTWTDGSSNWSANGHWDLPNFPNANGDNIKILNTDGVPRTISYDFTGFVNFNALQLGLTNGAPAATETLTLAANALTVNTELIGTTATINGNGTLNHSGGTNTLNGTGLFIGNAAGDKGFYNLSAAGSLV